MLPAITLDCRLLVQLQENQASAARRLVRYRQTGHLPQLIAVIAHHHTAISCLLAEHVTTGTLNDETAYLAERQVRERLSQIKSTLVIG